MAGPNGSGKTSLIEDLIELGHLMQPPLSLPKRVINPDEMRKSSEVLALASSTKNLDQLAQKLAYQQRQALIAARGSFAFETVMSHPSRLVELRQLRDQGYSVYLIFITTNSPNINVDRVKFRVLSQTTTGHNVPERNIRERYYRTLNLLPAAIELADHSVLYDNSYSGQARSQQAHISRANLKTTGAYDVVSVESPADWVKVALERITDRAAQRTALVHVATNLHADVQLANPVDGAYRGKLVHCGADYFGLLDILGQRSVLTVHDRLMLIPPQQQLLQERLHDHAGRDTEINYRPNAEPAIRDAPAV
jgi:predicted ABC-type ATPase